MSLDKGVGLAPAELSRIAKLKGTEAKRARVWAIKAEPARSSAIIPEIILPLKLMNQEGRTKSAKEFQ
jgi:hypothetical protein